MIPEVRAFRSSSPEKTCWLEHRRLERADQPSRRCKGERPGESVTRWRPAATRAGGSKPVAAARPLAPAQEPQDARHSRRANDRGQSASTLTLLAPPGFSPSGITRGNLQASTIRPNGPCFPSPISICFWLVFLDRTSSISR
jgi:hypothetical protein